MEALVSFVIAAALTSFFVRRYLKAVRAKPARKAGRRTPAAFQAAAGGGTPPGKPSR